MPTPSELSPAAVSYAKALLELANEQGGAVDVGSELNDLRQLVDADASLRQFLADPAIAQSDRTGVLDRALRGRVSPLMYNFMGVLNGKGRLGLIDAIAAAYAQMLDEQLGNVEVGVTVAHPLSDEQLAQVQQKVSQSLGKNAVVHQTVDDSIIGGMVLRVRDQLIDASVRQQLQAMRQRLLTAGASS